MNKKVVSLIAATAMLLPAVSLAEETEFDSSEKIVSSWAEKEMSGAGKLSLIPDDLDITDYTQPINRADFCSVAAELIEARGFDITVTAENPFTDISDNNVIFMAQNGIVEGKEEGIFDAGTDIKREEAAAILYRIAQYINIKTPELKDYLYNDDADISQWAKDAVYIMYALDIMNGTDNDRFSPGEKYSAEQAVITMLRMYEAAEREEDPTTKAGKLNSSRLSPECAVVGDKIYAVGGYSEDNSFVNSIEISRDTSNKWAQTEASEYIIPNAAVTADSERIYIIGGKKDGNDSDSIVSYNVNSRVYNEEGSIGEPIHSADAVYKNGSIYVVNAQNDSGKLDYMIVHELETGKNEHVEYPEKFDEVFATVCGEHLYIFGKKDNSAKVFSYTGTAWKEEGFNNNAIDIISVLSDNNDIYIITEDINNATDVYRYSPDSQSCEVIMDGYIKGISDCAYGLNGDYLYLIGGVNRKGELNNSEQYYYTWTCVNYDPYTNDYPASIGFDYDNHDKRYNIIPEINGVNVTILDEEAGLYELSMDGQYTCDPEADPYFFWSSGSGNFDGANDNYSRVIYHGIPGATSYITVGMGDMSGFTDKARFTIPSSENQD